MSLLLLRRGSRFSCITLPSRILLKLRCPRLSPLLPLGLWTLLYVACHFRSFTLVYLDAHFFESRATAINPANAVLLSVSGDSDTPLGSWNAAHVIPVSLHRQSAVSMQHLREVRGSDLQTDQGYEREDETWAEKDGRGRGKREQQLPTLRSASFQQTVTFHDNSTPYKPLMQRESQLETQVLMRPGQKHGSLLQHHFGQTETGRGVLNQWMQKPSPQGQEGLRHYLKLTDGLAAEQRGQPPRSAAYIQSLATSITQQKQHRGQELQRERASHQGESRAPSRGMMQRQKQVASRLSEKDVRPVFVSTGEQGDDARETYHMRKKPLSLETRGMLETHEKTYRAPQYVPTSASGDENNSRVSAQHIPPFLGREGEREALLETRERSRGIGTILAGAGLSTLLGGLNQYQQGPLAAGPPGSAVPLPGGAPVAAAPLSPAPAAAAMPALSPGSFTAPAAVNPFAAAAAAPEPESSSGHNIIPITVGIILGLVVLCLIGGCVFKLMKKKKRR